MIESNLSGLDTIITACVAAFGGYLGAYFKKGAEIQSMSDNIKELAEQQKKIAEATEQVKQDIEHQVWRKKELELVRRQKMEEFAILCMDLPQHITDEFSQRSLDINADYDRHHYKKFMFIQRLYLPNFEIDVDKLVDILKKYDDLVTELQKEINPNLEFLQNYTPRFREIRNELEFLSADVISKVRDEIEKMGHA
ncbi:hypothetical protein FJD32_003905 [Shewanella sp. LC6]|uniref:hypothetical protein n=1 Tax=Shewanella TaxID=22 RepID=UPI00112C8012|nr:MULTISPECIES: hypothetical protein [Shewanella]QQK58728.1 hypothetical protein FJD32_003905 [Shewanella sp. LC6]TPE53426.1 hypothetical protein FJD33_18090 [Shewanella sp. LC2]TVL32417.1 hypothetical protein AYI95_09580 [Shewanella xiamenensis]